MCMETYIKQQKKGVSNFVVFPYGTAPQLCSTNIVFSCSFEATRATRHPDSVINGGRIHKATTAPRGAETAFKWRDMAQDGCRHGSHKASRELRKGGPVGPGEPARALRQHWAEKCRGKGAAKDWEGVIATMMRSSQTGGQALCPTGYGRRRPSLVPNRLRKGERRGGGGSEERKSMREGRGVETISLRFPNDRGLRRPSRLKIANVYYSFALPGSPRASPTDASSKIPERLPEALKYLTGFLTRSLAGHLTEILKAGFFRTPKRPERA